ncbi:MAG: hypothetical protein AB1430_09195 [Pseudomonadota bacterium]
MTTLDQFPALSLRDQQTIREVAQEIGRYVLNGIRDGSAGSDDLAAVFHFLRGDKAAALSLNHPERAEQIEAQWQEGPASLQYRAAEEQSPTKEYLAAMLFVQVFAGVIQQALTASNEQEA